MTVLTKEEVRHDEVLDAVAHLWADAHHEASERVAVIEEYVGGVVAGGEDPAARRAALSAAHKLAGTLGTFGFPAGSELSRSIEHSLEDGAPAGCTAVAIAEPLDALRRLLDAAAPSASGAASERFAPSRDELRRGTVLVLGGGRAFNESLRFEVQRIGFTLVETLADLGHEPSGTRLALIEHRDDAATIAAVRRSRELGASVFVIGADLPASLRIAAVEAGAELVLDRSTSARRVIQLMIRAEDRRAQDPAIAVLDVEPVCATGLVGALVDLGCRASTLELDAAVVEGPSGIDALVVGSSADPGSVGRVVATLRADPRWDRVALIAWSPSEGCADERPVCEFADDVVGRDAASGVVAERVRRVARRHRRISDSVTPVVEPDDFDSLPLRGPVRTARTEVVVVDDDPTIRALLADMLDREGLTARPVDDGIAAADLLSDPAQLEHVAFVLLDVSLPGLDGFGVLRRMQAAGTAGSVPVAMLTARTGEDDLLRSWELGITEHIAKPFSVPVLTQRLHALAQREIA